MKSIHQTFILLCAITILFGSCASLPEDTNPCINLTVSIVQQGTNDLTSIVNGGKQPYTYEWSTGSVLSAITMYSSGTYSLTVTDANGCTAAASFDFIYFNGCEVDSITDADGNVYAVITIGNQCWMASNLKVSAGIPEVTDSATWVTTTSPAWCYYDNNPDNANYGKLYNWYAVQSGSLCPEGWHISTYADWDELENFLGDEPAGQLKTIEGWVTPNVGATNSSGFSAIPGGYRSYLSSHFTGLFEYTGFWTSTEATFYTAHFRAMSFDSPWLTNLSTDKHQGYSCRCVKN